MKQLPPLDVHAHVSTGITNHSLENLGAVVLIATRSLKEYDQVRNRRDRVSIWGVGCHPMLVGAQREFSPAEFKDSLSTTPYISEVGIDGSSRVPIDIQLQTFRSILRISQSTPRVTSIHSYRAAPLVLAALQEEGAPKGNILHWWLGTEEDTRGAIHLGCSFSINYSMAKSTEFWQVIPLDRLLIETDHPSGDRFSPNPRQPGRVEPVEKIVAQFHGISTDELRLQVWKNFARIVLQTQTYDLFPAAVKRMLDFASTQD